ncbi:MAG TPA: hypothetical protein VGF75_01995 [Candidatus Saccharimonadales bacterium]|jgi:hypothetical protein
MSRPSRITVYIPEAERKKLEKSAKAKKHSVSQETRILLLEAIERTEGNNNE